jgi:exosortase/archaeosortase family protein
VSVAIAASHGRSARAGRLLVAAALAIAATALIATEATTRAAEAVLAREFIGLVAPGRAVAAGPIVWFGIGTDEVTGLVITTMCSTTVLAVPLLLLAVAITGITRAPTSRVGLGLLVGLALAVTCNMIRFASAAWAYGAYGRDGFDLVHRYVGSLFVIVGFVLAIVLLLRIALREPGSRNRTAPGAPTAPESRPDPSLPTASRTSGSRLGHGPGTPSTRRDARSTSPSHERNPR